MKYIARGTLSRKTHTEQNHCYRHAYRHNINARPIDKILASAKIIRSKAQKY